MKRKFLDWLRRSRPALNLWMLLAFFLCSAACLVAVNALFVIDGMNSRLANLCEVGATAYESGGPDELLAALESFGRGVGVRIRLLDANGRDLVTGQDRSHLLSSARRKPAIPFLQARDARLILQTANYSCVAVTDLRRAAIFDVRRSAILTRPVIWVLPFLCLVCATFAWYVTLRIRRIEAAVTNFGSGKLGARVGPDGADPIGRLSRSFNAMAGRIESLVEAHRRLCTDISHELRSPLARLRLAVGLARSGNRGALDRIETEAARLHELVDELLHVARAEVDPSAIQLESVDLHWLLTEITDDCMIEAKERGCELDLKLLRHSTVRADPELLRRAIENVVRNAIHHSPQGTSIQLTANGDANSAVVSVRDRGPGIPEPALNEIFRPFYRVERDRDRSTGGTGLGLAIAERAIAVHHGSVKAENAQPGLRVEIRLPRIPVTNRHN